MGALVELLFLATMLTALAVALYRIAQLEIDLEEESARDVREPDAPEAFDERELERELLASPVELIRTACRVDSEGMDAEAVARIARHADRIAELLGRESQPEPESPASMRVDPVALLTDALIEFESVAHARGVAIHRHLEETGEVEVEAHVLDQAVRHLVRAAVESAREGCGDVTVALGEIDGTVHFAVADDGPGMTPHRIAEVLEPAAEPSSYAVVAGLARSLRGRFVLESGEGVGTRATLQIPVAITALQPAPATPATVSV